VFRRKGCWSKYQKITTLQGFFLSSNKRLLCPGMLFLFFLACRSYFSSSLCPHILVVKNGLVVASLLVSYHCLFCRIQGWWSRLPFLWYSFKVVLTKLYVIHPPNCNKPWDDQTQFAWIVIMWLCVNGWFSFCKVGILLIEMVRLCWYLPSIMNYFSSFWNCT